MGIIHVPDIPWDWNYIQVVLNYDMNLGIEPKPSAKISVPNYQTSSPIYGEKNFSKNILILYIQNIMST